MATTWPQARAWPTEARGYATYLDKYLRDTLTYVEQAQDQLVPANIVKSTFLGMLSLVINSIITIGNINTVQSNSFLSTYVHYIRTLS
ncbi:hypothetical protein GGR57DRAFT_267714 [Xylariaceae sp. FL1272]|nr:hypothetical protein GGR57DRAFT_267714 [Xylariaceae sp. FL1272]